jgi:hypothetical protein
MARKDANKGGRERSATRRVEAFAMRRAGHSFRVIAETLGVSIGQAHADVMETLRETATLEAEQREPVRQMEIARLDAWLTRVQLRIDAGEMTAVDVALRLQKRRADLLGLDAPKRLEATGPEGGPIVVTWGSTPPPVLP